MATSVRYPVHVDAELDQPLSRWLWLVKWVLAIPHFVVLAFLWVAFALLSFVAFFAILFTGRYPQAIFEFNVGVLRWTWRVGYYSFGALGTDRYPPFTLAERPDYPAHLSVDFPDHLSRGLVLVKWWLLAIPHYIVVGILLGGAWTVASRDGWATSVGLISVLVVIAAVTLLFTGRYPGPLYDLILGLNRWVLRVAGYVSLMTDVYPPFRLDMGGADPQLLAVAPTSSAPIAASGTTAPAGETTAPEPQPPGTSRWTAGPVVGVVLGSLLAVASLGALGAGGTALWADRIARDSDGYVTSPIWQLSTPQHALASEPIDLATGTPDVEALLPDRWLGTVRLRVTPSAGNDGVFVGLAPTSAALAYLSSSDYATVSHLGPGGAIYREHHGSTPPPPTTQTFWVASASGTGTQTLSWTPARGDWTVVVMNADGSAGVSVRTDVAATAPWLGWVAVGLLTCGLVIAGVAALVLVLAVTAAHRRREPSRVGDLRQQSS